MVHEKSIRLPSRLVGVHRTDSREVRSSAEQVRVSPGHSAQTAAADVAAEEACRERQAVQTTLARFQEATRALRAWQQKLLGEMQQLAVELATAVASRFLHGQAEDGKLPMELWIRQAVERLDSRQPVTVRIHPDDLALLEQRLGQEISLDANNADFRLAPDATMGRGSFQAQAGEVSLSADLDGQLAEMRRRLLEAVAAQQG